MVPSSAAMATRVCLIEIGQGGHDAQTCDRAPPAVGDQKRSPSAASRTHDKACFGKRRGGEVSGGPALFGEKRLGLRFVPSGELT